MNYCLDFGSKVKSFWKVCAKCGHYLPREGRFITTHKKPEIQIKKVETAISTDNYPNFKPKKTYGPFALIFGMIGLFLSLVIIIIRIKQIILISTGLLINNFFIIFIGLLAVIFGIVGIFKDDSQDMAIVGLVFGTFIFVLFFFRVGLYIRS
ncbi:MAG: hypothetical protein ACFFBH_02590 [Promethearchaeota archaeon]